jgi:hypothetical protein
LAILKSAALFSVYFDFVRSSRHENGNFKKNVLSKIESQCHADSKDIFGSKIVQVLSEKNVFKLDAAFAILSPRPVFQSILTLCVIYRRILG